MSGAPKGSSQRGLQRAGYRTRRSWKAQRDATFAHMIPRPKDRLVVTPDESMVDALVHFFHAHMGSAALQ